MRFKWTAGDTHTYKVTQHTLVRETTLDPKTEKPVVSEARTSLTLTRKWRVRAVDDKGIATLEMSITAMKNEMRKSDNETLVRDSAKPEDAKEMAAFLNVPIVVVRVDSQGRIVEVKEAKGGSAARLHAELPFRMILPDAAPAIGDSWERTFTMKLDPPLGTGESYDFVQKFSTAANADGLVSAMVETRLKRRPRRSRNACRSCPCSGPGTSTSTPAPGHHACAVEGESGTAELPGRGDEVRVRERLQRGCGEVNEPEE